MRLELGGLREKSTDQQRRLYVRGHQFQMKIAECLAQSEAEAAYNKG